MQHPVKPVALMLLLAWLLGAPALAATLTVMVAGETRALSSAALLARADVTTLTIGQDVSYGRTMSYRAVPLRALLAGLNPGTADTIEVRATDGFVAQLPLALLSGVAVPWVAIEQPAQPWPPLPNKTISAGPFYLVWQNPERAGVSPEQWPYAIASLTAVASPALRWPVLAVDAALPASAPERRGAAVFAANCLACHRLGGGGEANVGPDLLQPMPATAYLSDAGLRALIRNPAAVRSWPDQRMPAFAASVIGDSDVDAVIAYLHHLAGRR